MEINCNPNCPNKNCEGGVITYNGQSGRVCKKCNPDWKTETTWEEKLLKAIRTVSELNKKTLPPIGYVSDGLYHLGEGVYTGKEGWEEFDRLMQKDFNNG